VNKRLHCAKRVSVRKTTRPNSIIILAYTRYLTHTQRAVKRLAGTSAVQTFIHQCVVLSKINNFKTFQTKIPAVISIYA